MVKGLRCLSAWTQSPRLRAECQLLLRATALPCLLQVLSLNNLGMTALPPALGGMRKLRFLFLKSLPISAIPEFIGNLTALEQLHLLLPRSLTSSLPESIFNFTCLRKVACDKRARDSMMKQLMAAGLGVEGRPRLAVDTSSRACKAIPGAR